jgi:preprotein translocase SecE subunit
MENSIQKWVNFSFIAAAVLVAFILDRAFGSVAAAWDLETRIRNIELYTRVGSLVFGLIAFLVMSKTQSVQRFTQEVVTELTKVTWPAGRETLGSTGIVIVMVLISSVVLGLLDFAWTKLLQWIL